MVELPEKIQNIVTQAYHERAQLLSFFTTMHDSVIAYNDAEDPNWPILYVNTIEGQMSWHIAPGDMYLFNHVPVVENDDHRAQWDGHDTEEKYKRFKELVEVSVKISESASRVLASLPMSELSGISIQGILKDDNDDDTDANDGDNDTRELLEVILNDAPPRT